MYDFSCLNVPPQAGRLVELAECLCQTIKEECGLPLCWCGIYPGGVPSWDYCGGCSGGNCGMGYVSLAAASMYTTFGVPSVSDKCGTMLQASVTIGVLRCVPMEEDGSLPSAGEMSDTALLLFADMMAIRNAALCCYQGDIQLAGYSALPIQGGCVGGQWQAMVGLD